MTEKRESGVINDALKSYGADPTTDVLAYIPKRRQGGAAGANARDLTLQTGFIPPCLPMTAPAAPLGSQWLHEIKHDGFRIIARKDGPRVTLYGRSGDDLTFRYPLIVEAMAQLPSCTIDGEAIACDESGLASFDLLQRRVQDERVFLYAFDLIELSGVDRRRDALSDRKAELGRLLAGAGPGVLTTEWVDGKEFDGPTVFRHVCSNGLEGLVSKRKDSRYMAGRSPYWLKMTNPESAAARRASKAADSPDDETNPASG